MYINSEFRKLKKCRDHLPHNNKIEYTCFKNIRNAVSIKMIIQDMK